MQSGPPAAELLGRASTVYSASWTRTVFRAFDEAGVEYAVFGAVALGLHGLARATADLDPFIRPDPGNVDRLKAALRRVYSDPSIEDISPDDLCGDFPAVRHVPPDGFSLDSLTRLGTAFRFEDLDVVRKVFQDVTVSVVTAKSLWRMKKDAVRSTDRYDADVLAERFGFRED